MGKNKKQNYNFKFHIKTGDTVVLRTGNDAGRRGTVVAVDKEKGRAIVEGLNMKTKHVKPSTEHPEGNVIQIEGSIHISNLMVVDPKTDESTRIGRKRDDNGKLKRYSKKTGNFID